VALVAAVEKACSNSSIVAALADASLKESLLKLKNVLMQILPLQTLLVQVESQNSYSESWLSKPEKVSIGLRPKRKLIIR
jgi:hypothetical protein